MLKFKKDLFAFLFKETAERKRDRAGASSWARARAKVGARADRTPQSPWRALRARVQADTEDDRSGLFRANESTWSYYRHNKQKESLKTKIFFLFVVSVTTCSNYTAGHKFALLIGQGTYCCNSITGCAFIIAHAHHRTTIVDLSHLGLLCDHSSDMGPRSTPFFL